MMTGWPWAYSEGVLPKFFGDGGARLPARDRLAIHRSLSESQPQHVRQPQNPRNFVCSLVNPGCCGWDTRAPFHLGNTPLTLPPFFFLLGAPGDWKVAQTRGQECPRYVAQAFQPAGSGDFPVPN